MSVAVKGNVRVPFLGGNWKCMGSRDSVRSLVTDLNAGVVPVGIDVCVAPTNLHLATVQSIISKQIFVAAQNCSKFVDGAYTGEVSAPMLADFGIRWVILGHSERRSLFGDSDSIVAEKVALALKSGLSVIACVGETLKDRESGQTNAVLERQLSALAGAISGNWASIVVAYEPVWAIGTGVVATPEQAQDTHQFVRSWISKAIGVPVAESLRIIYGGSVKGSNAAGLSKKPDIDGFLVGGASLVGSEFLAIASSLTSKL